MNSAIPMAENPHLTRPVCDHIMTEQSLHFKVYSLFPRT